MQEGFYDVSTKKLWDKRTAQAKANGYKWGTSFPNCDDPTFDDAKSHYHGNSKLILQLFHNDITGKDEMNYGTKSIYKSYPQYKGKLEIL